MTRIRQWLDSHDMGQYAAAFESSDIDVDVLPGLTDEALQKIGVSSVGHRMRLLAAIRFMPTSAGLPDQVRFPPAAEGDTSAAGERRQATVLFSDLSGYTAMNERLDPEEVREIIGRIKTEAVRVVEGHGGIVNQFVGDEVMALFGIPQAHEDDPVRAVRAALDLHAMARALPQMEERIAAPLRFHSGICTGLIVTGSEDRRDGAFGVTGDPVNTAARLAAHADTDTVLVSEEIQRLIADYFLTEPQAPLALKGKGGLVTPYRVSGATGIGSRFEAAAQRGLTAFSGRDAEMNVLRARLAKAQEGCGQLVTVSGEPGIGKSRLLFEFRRSLRRDAFTVLIGRCQSYGADTPYLPMVDVLKRLLRVGQVRDSELLSEHVVTAVRAISPSLEGYLPQVLHLLSIPSASRKMPSNLQGEALRRSFEQTIAEVLIESSKRRPLVLMLEDWHWADEASESALRHLIGAISNHALQVIVSCRPDYQREWAPAGEHYLLSLQPLSADDTAAIVRVVWQASSLADAVASAIHARTSGNPLFSEELARRLAEDGKVMMEDGRATLADPSAVQRVPDSVQSVVRARIDRLPKEAREMLRLASVIGREFALQLLEELHATPVSIPDTMVSLVQQDLLVPSRTAPEPTYQFKHALMQDAAYDTLLLSQRKELHAKVAAAMERLYAERLEERFEVLADHYSKSNYVRKAVDYLERSANKAASYSSLEVARAYCQRTIQLLDSLGETNAEQERRVRVSLKWAEIGTGFPTPELAYAVARAFECAKSLELRLEMLNLASWEAHIRTMLGEAERGLELANFVIAESGGSIRDPAIGRAHAVLGMSAMWGGNPGAAIDHARRGRPGLRPGMGIFFDRYLLIMGGLSFAFVGEFDNARIWFDQVKTLPAGDRTIEHWVHVFQAYALVEQAAWARASDAAQRGAAIARRHDDPWPAAWGTITDAYARFMAGDFASGYSALRAGVKELEERNLLYTISWAYAQLAEASLLLGREEEGTKLAEASRDALRDGDRIAEPMTLRAIALAGAIRTQNWTEILADLDAARDVAIRTGRWPQAALACFRTAECLHKKGDFPAAMSQATEAEKLFERIGLQWWGSQAAALRARIAEGKAFVWFAPYSHGAPRIQ